MLIFILILVIVYTFFVRKKLLKDKKQYLYYRDIPSNDSPALIGKIVKGHTDGNDIISTILDLSYRGYIKIQTEEIKGKEKTILYLEKNITTTEVKEHEMFLVNRIFKNNNRIIFEDYIKSKQLKQDFKAFDKMIERRMERVVIHKSSLLKNINKILLLVSYFMFGISIFYSILSPITFWGRNVIKLDIKTSIIINIISSVLLYLIAAYRYVVYIEKSTNARENINLRVTYIILVIIIGIFIMYNNQNIFSVFYEEFIYYKVIINFIISIITVLYMFNFIKHTEKQEYLYYIYLLISLCAIILKMKFAMGISILFFIVYAFFKVPKHSKLKQEDELCKWILFKKYLQDYSMLSEQDSNAIVIWEKYLIYAISLGVNKKIIKKYAQLNNIKMLNEVYLKKVYVEYFE